jgi:hypothetical protein
MSNGNVDPGSVGAGSDYKLNTWNHVAYVKSSGTIKIYVNGVSIASRADSYNASTNTSVFIGCAYNASQFTQGYLEDFRIVKGTAVYTTNFTPPTAPETAVSGTSLLLNMTNAGIPDLAMQNDLQTVGSAQVSTTQYKYGSSSLSFNGTNSQLKSPTTFIFGGDFTIEGWFYPSSSSTNYPTLLCANTANQLQFQFNSGFTAFYVNFGGSQVINGSTLSGVATNSWSHFAIVRIGSACTIYFNGISQGTFTSSASVSQTLIWGSDSSNANWWNGYLDDIRVTSGLARYVQPFTPPTTALPTY